MTNYESQKIEEYKTSDLYFASYLKVAGLELLNTEKEGKKIIFVFRKTEFIRDLKKEYFNKTAKVSALLFVNEIRNMKSLTHMARNDS